MTPPPNEALNAIHAALQNSAAQMNDTAAALHDAAGRLDECPLFAQQTAELQARIENAWLPLIANFLTQIQVLSSSVDRLLHTESDQ
ncbi:MAG: hypothetical protein HY866_23575 [Chloroflexi bacterium]|nr:hypothetical protein [Chloroflexota bacterium]